MSQSKQRLLELNSRLAQNLTDKGVEATADETTTALINKVADIQNGDDELLISIINRSITEINENTLPQTITDIGIHAFASNKKLTKITLPTRIKTIGGSAFSDCNQLVDVTLNTGLESIGSDAFFSTSIVSLVIPNTVTIVGSWTFRRCTKLTTVFIPNSVTAVNVGGGLSSFDGCSSLEFVNIENGFNCNRLNLSASTKYSRETIVSWFEALADRTGLKTYTLTIGATNIAKLTEEDIAIATNKNWTIA